MQQEKWKKTGGQKNRLGAALGAVPGKVWWAIGLLVWGLVMTAGARTDGGILSALPLGLAALASAGGVIGTSAVFFGALAGSASVGGILPLATAALFAVRAGISMWLVSEKGVFLGRSFPGRPKPSVRYSRASGWRGRGRLAGMTGWRAVLASCIPWRGDKPAQTSAGETARDHPGAGTTTADTRGKNGHPGATNHARTPVSGNPVDSSRQGDGSRTADDSRTTDDSRQGKGGKPADGIRLAGEDGTTVIDTGQRRQTGETDWLTLLRWADAKLFRESVFIRMALSSLGALAVGAWSVVNGGYVLYDLWGAIFSLLLMPPLVFLFYAAHDRRMRTSSFREPGILTAMAVTTYVLSGTTLPFLDLNPGQAFAASAAILTGSSFGVTRGTVVGLACGILLEPAYAPSYALAGALTGVFASPFGGAGAGETIFSLGQAGSRTLGLFAGAASGVAWAIYAGGLTGLRTLLPEMLLLTAAFLPFFSTDKLRLPDSLCGFLPDTRRSERTAVAEMVLAGREKKLSDLGSGMQSLGEMLGGVSEKLARPGVREMRDLVECCFDVYCDRCPRRADCRGEEPVENFPSAGENMTEDPVCETTDMDKTTAGARTAVFSAPGSRLSAKSRFSTGSGSGRKTDAADWSRMIGGMAKALCEDGGVCAVDVPPVYASRCGTMGRILDEINNTAAYRLSQRRSGDRLRVAADDYTHMGRLLAESARLEEEDGTPDTEMTARLEKLLSCHDFAAGSVSVYGTRHKRIFVHDIDLTGTRMGSEEIAALFRSVVGLPLSQPVFTLDGALISMEMHTLSACTCTVGRKTIAAEALRDGTSRMPSGDTVCAFQGDGKQYMLLSDGMGSGRMAALTSGMAAVFLERMLTAGATLETALKMLNSVIRAGCDECAATVDLCEVDLVTGEARFVKSGAAPSFVIRDGSLFRLQSKTVPIGILRALDAEMIRFTIEPGDVIVMLSDGITRSFEDCPWLLDLLSTDDDIRAGNVQKAAETIVRQAASRGAGDDITAGVMRVDIA